ncbi:MAG: hypothetical protein GYA34_15310 [Chloroflexi bacterium]|nr:hypothetical protein [Chloroflexota bacterium]
MTQSSERGVKCSSKAGYRFHPTPCVQPTDRYACAEHPAAAEGMLTGVHHVPGDYCHFQIVQFHQ